MCDRVIACTPADELAEAFPWDDEADTPLARKIWNRKIGKPARRDIKHEDYDYQAINKWMVENEFTNRELAERLGVCKGVVDRLRAGYYRGGPMIARLFEFMAAYDRRTV